MSSPSTYSCTLCLLPCPTGSMSAYWVIVSGVTGPNDCGTDEHCVDMNVGVLIETPSSRPCDGELHTGWGCLYHGLWLKLQLTDDCEPRMRVEMFYELDPPIVWELTSCNIRCTHKQVLPLVSGGAGPCDFSNSIVTIIPVLPDTMPQSYHTLCLNTRTCGSLLPVPTGYLGTADQRLPVLCCTCRDCGGCGVPDPLQLSRGRQAIVRDLRAAPAAPARSP